MLKVPEHQVAGHRASKGKPGPLVDDSGRFYKPLQSGDRGSNEAAFYEKFWSIEAIPSCIRVFFPLFHGTKYIEALDGSGSRAHLVLEDVVSARPNPSVMDVKIGARTWYPRAPEDYVAKCLKKDRAMSSSALGFRISGLQVFYGVEGSGYWKPAKKTVQGFAGPKVVSALRKFVSSNNNDGSDDEPDCALAELVYGGSDGILAQLSKLKVWFEDQTFFHFNSCSVLVVYGSETGQKQHPVIKLVDFAHVYDGEGVIDHNFLGGMCSLIKFIKDIMDSLPLENGIDNGKISVNEDNE